MAFKHGKNGQVSVGSTPVTLKVTGWSADDETDLADSSNTSGGGFKEQTAGLCGVDWSIDAQFDAAASPYATPSLASGTILTALKLYVDVVGTGVPNYIFPLAIVGKVSIKSVVNGMITWTITGKSQGTFTPPGNTV